MQWQFLTEFADSSWCPQFVRDELTETMRHFIVTMKAYDAIITDFLWALQQSSHKNVIDLCSGASGPWECLLQVINKFEFDVQTVTLTDISPNRAAQERLRQKYPDKIICKEVPVDARNIAPELCGVRTIFSAFHHFTTEEAQAILQDAVNKEMSICIFEITERSYKSLLHIPVATILPFAQRLFRRPLSLPGLFLTYALPIIPLLYWYDVAVSHLRSYSPTELKEMAAALKNTESFQWESGKRESPGSLIKNTYLIGYPKRQRKAETGSCSDTQNTA